MSIKLNWVHHAAEDPDGFRIYRALSPIPDSPLPAPLVTLDGNVRDYLDTTTVRNTLYYYRIEVFKGSESSLSVNHKEAYLPSTGPGPSTILRGDSEIGFFGAMSAEQLILPTDLIVKLGIGGLGQQANNIDTWFKVIYKGKVLFTPNNTLTYNHSFAALYQAGLVYGTSDSSKYHDAVKTAYGTVDNGRVVVIGENAYVVRCPGSRAIPGSLDGTSADYVGGEYDQVIAPLYINRSVKATATQYYDATHNTNWAYTQDLVNTTTALLRGNSSGDATTPVALSSGGSSVGFYPILELQM